MSIAQHAERILAAWNTADPNSFATELERALDSCQNRRARSFLEVEQQELLESVVERLRQGSRSAVTSSIGGSAQDVSAGFALLQHLSHRVAA